ncbi:MAG: aspartyl/asparaginyl beta-hydroxylase domain-containing protein [Myxococcales bacterium]|nr:aspartyl/asparaginyl beta-hydroxylase domain-containing protein [Myxococcales bacterium]
MLYQRPHRPGPSAIAKPYRFRRLGGFVDVAPALAELDALPAEAWLPSQWKWHLGTRFLILRGGPSGVAPGSALTAGGGVDAPALASLPALRALLDEAFPEPAALAWVGLSPAGSRIHFHVDNTAHWDAHHRVHLPLRTSPGARLCVDAAFLHLPAGTLWAFNNSRPHGALNTGPDRLHLMVDLPATPAVEAWIAAGEDVAGAPDPAARQALCRNPLDALQPDDLKGDLLVRLLDQ